MTKLITSKDKVVIKLEMDRLLATPPILLEGQKQVLGKTLSAMIAQIAWRYIGSKKPGFFTAGSGPDLQNDVFVVIGVFGDKKLFDLQIELFFFAA